MIVLVHVYAQVYVDKMTLFLNRKYRINVNKDLSRE